jgi:hypothetical protein
LLLRFLFLFFLAFPPPTVAGFMIGAGRSPAADDRAAWAPPGFLDGRSTQPGFITWYARASGACRPRAGL